MTTRRSRYPGCIVGAALTCVLSGGILTSGQVETATGYRTFETPDAAVQALTDAVKRDDLEAVLAIFGPEGQALIDSSDAVTARRNREIFAVAVAEHWRLEDQGPSRKILVIGHEEWPFPVPLVQDGAAWRFDTAAGREEILARRVGRNELAAIRACRTYVVAQRLYAKEGHDGKPPGRYARAFQSDPGTESGLYWPARPGTKRSPLGDLLAAAADDTAARRRASGEPAPFHGYYFRIVTAQGPSAPGGAKDYVVNGEMTGGFALVAWPAQYDVTGVMTFIVNHDGVLHEKDLGPGTAAAAQAMTLYAPDATWARIP